MPISIEMPKLSDTMTEGTLVKWRKKIGDKVDMGDVIAEIETDKATMEMEAFDDGTLAEIFVAEGEKVAVGQKIALLALPGEKAGEVKEATPRPAVAASTHYQEVAGAPVPGASGPVTPVPPKGATPAMEPAGGAHAREPQERIKASPLARKIAARKGVDLSRIAGSGPGGRILQRDVLAPPSGGVAEKRTQAAPGAAAPVGEAATAVVPPLPAGPRDKVILLTGMRRVIAERLVASKSTIPHFYLQIEADAGPLLRLRAKVNAAAGEGAGKITINDFILKAAVAALVRVPGVNAAWADEAIIQYAEINLAVAVAIEGGLITPVLRNVGCKSLREISDTVKDLAVRARNKRLKIEEYQGGTFTVSNLGSYGVDSFHAIVNPPQAAILSVGAVTAKPVLNDAGQVVAGQRITFGMSCDHRVVDGALGSQYLAELRRLIEAPALMLL